MAKGEPNPQHRRFYFGYSADSAIAAGTTASHENEIRQPVAGLPARAHVALQLTDGNTLPGHIENHGDQNFVLNPDNGGAPETIAYEQVSTVEQLKKHSNTKWIIIGMVAEQL